jgi:hypothetical protein
VDHRTRAATQQLLRRPNASDIVSDLPTFDNLPTFEDSESGNTGVTRALQNIVTSHHTDEDTGALAIFDGHSESLDLVSDSGRARGGAQAQGQADETESHPDQAQSQADKTRVMLICFAQMREILAWKSEDECSRTPRPESRLPVDPRWIGRPP